MLTVTKKGILASIQDGGRYGYQRFGVPVCGAMDMRALRLANILAGNPQIGGAIEIIGGGLALRFESDNIFALSGAEMGAKLDGVAVEVNRAHLAKKGQELSFGFGQNGLYAYLAVCGGFAVPQVLGSQSTYLKGKLGGVDGRALCEGDKIQFCAPQIWLENLHRRAWKGSVGGGEIRVVLGPQQDNFCFRGIKTFLTGEFKIGNDSDRMGYRLSGAEIDYAKGRDGNIISDGIVRGSVQVSGGQPMIMMSDAQTTGGYAKIATVISCDLPRLAQKRAGEMVRFAEVTQERARQLLIAEGIEIARFEADINEPFYEW